MKVYITVEIFHGIIEEVNCYSNYEIVKKKEKEWLKDNEIKTKEERENKSDFHGVEFRIFEDIVNEKCCSRSI